MTQQWTTLFTYTAIPAVLMAIGSIIAWFKQPGPKLTSIVQHFAGGVVIAAVAAELVPKIIHHPSQWFVALGFAVGIIVMFATNWFAETITKSNSTKHKLPLGMILAVAVDVFIDGLLIGVAFLASKESGIIIAFALTLEVFFLGISTTASMTKRKVKKNLGIAIMIAIALLIPIGALLGFSIVSQLSNTSHIAILAFGTAALLYLVTEELLTEAHEVPETRMATLSFFVGFLIILLIAQ